MALRPNNNNPNYIIQVGMCSDLSFLLQICILLFTLLLCFSLGVFLFPLLALEKGLYLREQDTGQNLYLMVG